MSTNPLVGLLGFYILGIVGLLIWASRYYQKARAEYENDPMAYLTKHRPDAVAKALQERQQYAAPVEVVQNHGIPVYFNQPYQGQAPQNYNYMAHHQQQQMVQMLNQNSAQTPNSNSQMHNNQMKHHTPPPAY